MTFLTRTPPAAQGRASAQVVGERSADDPTAHPIAPPLCTPATVGRGQHPCRSAGRTPSTGARPPVPSPRGAPRVHAAGPLSSPGEERDRERSPGGYDPDSAYSLSLAAFTYPKAPSLPPPLATYFCR